MSEITVSILPDLARTINQAQQNGESLLTEALSHSQESEEALNQAKPLPCMVWYPKNTDSR